jgi:hypothetical protein
MKIGTNTAAALALGAFGMSILPRPTEETILAREYLLVDEDGKPAARLGTGPHGEPMLSFLHPRGSARARLELGLGVRGDPYLELSDSEAASTENGADLRLSIDGEPGEPMVLLSRKEEGSTESVDLRLGIGRDLKPSVLLSAPKVRKTLSIESVD